MLFLCGVWVGRVGWVGRVRSLILTSGPDQPRLDAEFAERETLVGVKGDVRRRGEDQILAARVLEQIGAQLVDDLVLDALIAFAVLGREPHRVLVRDVHARDRDGTVGVHLAGELAGELHRPDLRAEHPSEGALDEVGDHGLDALERVHRRTAGRIPRRSAGNREPCYAPFVRQGRAERGRRPRSRRRGRRRGRRRAGWGASRGRSGPRPARARWRRSRPTRRSRR